MMLTEEEQKTFDAAMVALLNPFEQSDGPKQTYTDNGDPYVQIYPWTTSESGRPDIIFCTLKTALEAWQRNFLNYMTDKDAIIWRVRPDADAIEAYYEPQFEAGGVVPICLHRFRRYAIYGRLYAFKR